MEEERQRGGEGRSDDAGRSLPAVPVAGRGGAVRTRGAGLCSGVGSPSTGSDGYLVGGDKVVGRPVVFRGAF